MERPSLISCVMDFCDSIKERSTCKRLKVGAAVLSNDQLKILGYGYNGQPRGLPNNGCTGIAGSCGCQHAEANAVLKAGWTDRSVLICTHAPCHSCSGLIINAGVCLVVFKDLYRNNSGLLLLREAGLGICRISKNGISTYDPMYDRADDDNSIGNIRYKYEEDLEIL